MSLQKSNLSPRVLLVADDLTGACDAAAPFASRGQRTQVLLDGSFAGSQAAVQSVCTASRDVPPEVAVAVVRNAMAGLARDRHAEPFKKVDSVFRGNTLVEMVAALASVPRHLAVIAPAFPAQGRVCADGHLHRTDAAGQDSIPLRQLFAAASLHPHWLSASDHPAPLAAAMQGADAVFCEATTQQHLHVIVQAARSLGRPIFWIGSAGLAGALAEALYPDSPPPSPLRLGPGRLLIFSGSQHPVTESQHIALGDDAAVLRVTPICTDEEIRTFVQAGSHQQPTTLLLNGGDTALRVCRALGIDSLCLQGEYAPGIPVATARGGALQGAQVILKSGGFGDDNLFKQIAGEIQA